MEGNRTNRTAGGSYFRFEHDKHLLYVVIAVLTVIVNTFVILLFACKRNLRKLPNYLFISLSFSDLLTGLVGIPLVLVCSVTPNCMSCILSQPFMLFTSISTVLHILVITYERFVKIVFPFDRKFMDMKIEVKAIGVIWAISPIFSLVPLTWSHVSEKACYADETEAEKQKDKVYYILLLIFFVVLPILLIVIADVSVFVVVRRQLDRIQGTSLANDRNTHERTKKEAKVVAVMATMMGYFVVCWAFFYTVLFLQTLSDKQEFQHIPPWLAHTFDILRTSTCLVNPILYVLLKHDFRQTLAGELGRLKCSRRPYTPGMDVAFNNNAHAQRSQSHTEGTLLPLSNTQELK